MATHSSILVWRIPWTKEPGGLQSMGSQRVGHDKVTNTFTFCPREVYSSPQETYTDKGLKVIQLVSWKRKMVEDNSQLVIG